MFFLFFLAILRSIRSQYDCSLELGVQSQLNSSACWWVGGISDTKRWDEIVSWCRSFHPLANLASFHNESESSAVMNISMWNDTAEYWTGATSMIFDGAVWQYSDGTSFDYAPWEGVEPTGEGCVWASSPGGVFGYHDDVCWTPRRPVCKLPLCFNGTHTLPELCPVNDWNNVHYVTVSGDPTNGSHCEPLSNSCPSPFFDSCNCHGFDCVVEDGNAFCDCPDYSDENCTVRARCGYQLGIPITDTFYNSAVHKCYYWSRWVRSPWSTALAGCQYWMHPDSTMISIHSDEESVFVFSIIPNIGAFSPQAVFSIGLSNRDLATLEMTTPYWSNVDGSPFDYEPGPWLPGYPSIGGGCAKLYKSGWLRWGDNGCVGTNLIPFCQLQFEPDDKTIVPSPTINVTWTHEGSLCEFENVECPSPQNECFGVKYDDPDVCFGNGTCKPLVGGNECQCDFGFEGRYCQFQDCSTLLGVESYYYNGSCYVVHNEKENWYDQVEYCRSLHPAGKLAVIHSDSDNRLLRYIPSLVGNDYFYVGVHDIVSEVWGAKTNWSTVDGSPQDFEYFNLRGQPNVAAGYDCVLLWTVSGTVYGWLTAHCQLHLHYALCQYPVEVVDNKPKRIKNATEWSRVTYDEIGAHCNPSSGVCPSPLFDTCTCNGYSCVVFKDIVGCDCPDYNGNCTVRERCEYELGLALGTTHYNPENNKCYFWEDSTLGTVSWGNSVNWCRTNMNSQATLVSLHDVSESDFLETYVSGNNYFAGHNNLDFETFDFDTPFFSNTDGSPWDYSNWMANEPDEGEGCGRLVKTAGVEFVDGQCDTMDGIPMCQLQYKPGALVIEPSPVFNVTWTSNGSFCDFENVECPSPQNECFGVKFDDENVCHGNGTCKPLVGGNKCQCSAGYYGRYCQFQNCTHLLGVDAYYYNGNCFVVRNIGGNWFEQLDYCRSLHPAGKLAVLHSDSDNRLLSGLPDVTLNWYWIGYHDIVSEVGSSKTGWTTVDGSLQDFGYFNLRGRPTGTGDCLQVTKNIAGESTSAFVWSDGDCSLPTNGALCQFPVCDTKICNTTEWDRVTYETGGAYCNKGTGNCPAALFVECNDCSEYACLARFGTSRCNCLDYNANCTVREKCEYELGLTLGTTHFNTENNKCYFWDDSTLGAVSWGNSVNWCRTNMHSQANLVSLSSVFDADFIESYMSGNNYFAGHNNLDFETFDYASPYWAYTDNSLWNYSNWKLDEPNRGEGCGRLVKGSGVEFTDGNCDSNDAIPMCYLEYKIGDQIIETSPVINVTWSSAGSYCDFQNFECPSPQNECFGVKHDDSLVCHGNGTCVPFVGGNKCQCDSGFFGRFCQFQSCSHLLGGAESYYYDGDCYVVRNVADSWYNQVEYCRSLNPAGNLVVLHSDTDNRLLSSIPGLAVDWYWIGYEDIVADVGISHTGWTTVDGSIQDLRID